MRYGKQGEATCQFLLGWGFRRLRGERNEKALSRADFICAVANMPHNTRSNPARIAFLFLWQKIKNGKQGVIIIKTVEAKQNLFKNLFFKNFRLPLHSQSARREFSSAGSEHLPYKQRVGGSNPSTPTQEAIHKGCFFFLFYITATNKHSSVCQKRVPNLLTLAQRGANTQRLGARYRRILVLNAQKQQII